MPVFSVGQLGGRSRDVVFSTQLSNMIMSRSHHLLAALLLLINIMALIHHVEAQEDSLGFITLDCGLPAGSSYVDEETGIKYISDEAFVETGVSDTISPAYNTSDTKPWLQTLRSFPEGERNCYKFPVGNDREFLVRATFMYGNYEGKNSSLSFSLYVDNGYWDDIRVDDPTSVISKEIILVTTIDTLFFCLMNSRNGTPFISLLELRLLKDAPYNQSDTPIVNLMRVNFGSTSSGIVRYPDDALDRFWKPLTDATWTTTSTLEAIDSRDCFAFQPPSTVMRTASLPKTGYELHVVLDVKYLYYVHVYLYFAELEKLGANQSRQIHINSSQRSKIEHASPKYLKTGIVQFAELILWEPYYISLTKTINSTLPPAINALEVYQEIPWRKNTHSDRGTVDAIMRIKLAYGVAKNWQADPCSPWAWDGITCYYNFSDPPRIIALNLSFSGLVGAITAEISDLTDLETLDLSNNGLTGHVPEFFAQMPSLKILNLTFNKLNGTVPPALVKKAEKNLLLMNLTGNPDLCFISCNSSNKSPILTAKTKKSLIAFLVLGSLVAALISAVTAIIVFRSSVISRRFISRKQGEEAYAKATMSLESMKGKKRHFTYSQLLAITNNFNLVLGQGGSGTVHLGHLHGNEVAVKIFSPSSVQGYKQFDAEVDILLRVHHGNLLSLIGYCDDNNHLGLIYEYMPNGNLQEYISSCDNKEALTWEERLTIALGAAHGLEYLHSGCKPQIVHRDVKTANILLNEKLQAKLADFGLSRSFPATGASHLFTDVAGTFGYFDPEYFRSRRFTTKSDVYSFGVVLLEIVTSKPAVDETESTTHLSQWVAATLLAEGETTQIIDPKLGVDFDPNSAYKVVQLALACVSESSSQRPTMHQVVVELTDCLELELARRNDGNEFVDF